MINCKILPPPTIVQDAIQFVEENLDSLFKEYFEKNSRKITNREYSFSGYAFIQLWMTGAVELIVAYDGNTYLGFLIALRFSPLAYRAQGFQLESWYGKTEEVESAMFKYLNSQLHALGVNEIWVCGDGIVNSKFDWPVANAYTMTRHVNPVEVKNGSGDTR